MPRKPNSCEPWLVPVISLASALPSFLGGLLSPGSCWASLAVVSSALFPVPVSFIFRPTAIHALQRPPAIRKHDMIPHPPQFPACHVLLTKPASLSPSLPTVQSFPSLQLRLHPQGSAGISDQYVRANPHTNPLCAGPSKPLQTAVNHTCPPVLHYQRPASIKRPVNTRDIQQNSTLSPRSDPPPYLGGLQDPWNTQVRLVLTVQATWNTASRGDMHNVRRTPLSTFKRRPVGA